LSDEYATAAPYVHLFSAPMWGELAPAWTAALAETGTGTVIELGAGTGAATETILAAVPGAPVVVAEPSAALRAVLLARLATMPGGERVTVHPVAAQELRLPERVAAVAGVHMIGHLAPGERRKLFRALAARLTPGAPVVFNAFPPYTAEPVPPMPPMTATQGAATYRITGSAVPTGPDSVRWRTEYVTLLGGEIVDRVVTEYDWWVHSPERLAAELADAGLPARVDGDLVVGRAR